MKSRYVQFKELPGLEGECAQGKYDQELGRPYRNHLLGDRERSHGRAMNKDENGDWEYITNPPA